MSGICLFCIHAQSLPQPKNRLFGKPMNDITDFLIGKSTPAQMIFCHEHPDKHWEANALNFSCGKFAKAPFEQTKKRIDFYKQSNKFNPAYEQISLNI